MSRRNRTRAARRRLERAARNVLALETAEALEEERPKRHARARHVDQLTFLEGRGAITDEQCRAGERLASDFAGAGGMPHMIANYGAPMAGRNRRAFCFTHEDQNARAADARRRFECALETLGPLWAITFHVSICDLPATDWHRPGLKNGDGLALLRLGLDTLVDHYRMPRGEEASPADPAYLNADGMRANRVIRE